MARGDRKRSKYNTQLEFVLFSYTNMVQLELLYFYSNSKEPIGLVSISSDDISRLDFGLV